MKLEKVKSVLIWTNPLTYVVGIPVFAGFVVAAMTDGIYKRTSKIVKRL